MEKKSFWSSLAVPAAAALLSAALIHPSYAEDAAADPASIEAGKAAYAAQCARCHGPTGAGNGFDAARLPVAPRDLTSGVFKFRTTASGTPPTDDDLMHVLNHGLSGSGMPAFGSMDTQAKKEIIAYIKTLSPVFAQYKPQAVAAPNTRLKYDPKKGLEAYNKLQCALCHGQNGLGNGPSAPTLVDQWGKPIRAANLTHGWTYRAGSSAKDIYYRLMAGLNGTPMPSYDGAVTPDEAWQLANYVASLQLKENWSSDIYTRKLREELPVDVDDARWKDAPYTDVNLEGQVYRGGRKDTVNVEAVRVRVVQNDKGLAFHLMWSDATQNDRGVADAVLLAMKPANFRGETRANLFTLYGANAPAVDAMYWQAADPAVARQKVSAIDAALRSAWSNSNVAPARAKFNDGVWQVVLHRPFNLDAAHPVDPKQDVIQVGFEAWDGENKETDQKRASSRWLNLHLGAGPSAAHH